MKRKAKFKVEQVVITRERGTERIMKVYDVSANSIHGFVYTIRSSAQGQTFHAVEKELRPLTRREKEGKRG